MAFRCSGENKLYSEIICQDAVRYKTVDDAFNAVMAQRRGEFLLMGMFERLASLRPELQAKVDSLQMPA